MRDGRQRKQFEYALAQTEEAKVSTHSFNEDAFAGLKTALDKLYWAPYQSRLVSLMTDAGAIRNGDPYSSTGMNEAEIADLRQPKGSRSLPFILKLPQVKSEITTIMLKSNTGF